MRILFVLLVFFCSKLLVAAPIPSLEKASMEATCTLPAPDNLHVTDLTPNSVSLAWDPVIGADHYHVRVTEEGTGLVVFDGTIPIEAITVTNIESMTAYAAEVDAVDAVGEHGPAAKVLFTTPFIITDETIVKLPSFGDQLINPTHVEPGNSVFFAVGYSDGSTNDPIYEPFWFTRGTEGAPHTVGHPNLGTGDEYEPIWQFGSEDKTLPPQEASYNAKFVNVYKLSDLATGSTFPFEDLKLSIFFTLNGDDLSLTTNIQPGNGLESYWLAMPSHHRPPPPAKLAPVTHSATATTSLPDDQIRFAPIQSPIGETRTAQPVPNPFSNFLSIDLDPYRPAGTTIQLVDSNGRTVRAAKPADGQRTAWLETAAIQPGIYFLRCGDDEGVKTFKVVKLARR